MQPLIFFVHVPKTCGSTINAILHEELADGVSHCESIIANDTALAEAAATVDWMSGHVDLSTAQRRLAATTDRPVRFFTCLREPTAQVMSHYNWLIEIYHRGGDFYEKHPAAIKLMSETIRGSRVDASGIIANLERYAGLFRNCQSRMVLGANFDWDAEALHKRLSEYEAISPDSSGLSSLLSQMLGRDFSIADRRENVSSYRFDSRVFESEAMQAFLRQWNVLDHMLCHQAVSVCYGGH